MPAPLPLRPELRGLEPYGAPQLDVPARLNVNENPYPPSETVVADITARVAAAVRGLNRYPDRDFLDLRADLAAYLAGESGADFLTAEQIWAANGSNEVMLHLLQAFGGPGRTALSFAPTYSMYPEYARDTSTEWVVGRRAEDFTLDIEHAVAMIAEVRPSVILLASPNNPTGTALPLEAVEAVADAATASSGSAVPVVDEAYAEFRRTGTPSSLAARWRTRTSCSPRWTPCAPSAMPPWPGSRRGVCASRTRTRTSCCSGCSTTGTPSGAACWSVAC